jgi:hypothetical protein
MQMQQQQMQQMQMQQQQHLQMQRMPVGGHGNMPAGNPQFPAQASQRSNNASQSNRDFDFNF